MLLNPILSQKTGILVAPGRTDLTPSVVVFYSQKKSQKLYQHSKNQFLCHQSREQCNVCKKLTAAFLDAFSGCHCCVRCYGDSAIERPLTLAIAHYNGTQQWHHVHSPKIGDDDPTKAHYNGTLQWHPAMAPRPLPQTCPLPQSCRHSPPGIAHYEPMEPMGLRWGLEPLEVMGPKEPINR